MPRRKILARSALKAFLAMALVAVLLPIGPSFGTHPALPARWNGALPLSPAWSSSPIHPAAAPPPPFDWDPMFFQADHASATRAQVSLAAGAGTALAVSDPTKTALMFGGEVGGNLLTNQTWIVNQTSAIWTHVKERVAPSPRADFSLTGASGCGVAVLFGGLIDAATNAVANDTWLFDFTTERWVNITGPVGPAPRQGAAIAMDNRTCQALLFGGVNQDYRSGNSTGNVRWNDTWVLNVTNGSWSSVQVVNPPPSLADAGLLYDNVTGGFLMFGGCESLCASDLWSFSPTSHIWTFVRTSNGFSPSGRGGMAWSYSPTYDVAILSEGYTLQGTTKVALNDTYVYLISAKRFEQVGDPEPAPRYGQAAGWLSTNGCPGLLMVGGGAAPTNPPDQNFLDPAPDIPLACNTWGNDSITITGGGGAGCDPGFVLTVNVRAIPTLRNLAGASVTVGGNCSRETQLTDASGNASFVISWQPYDIWANATYFHSNFTSFTPVAPALNGSVSLELIPLPNLTVRSLVRGLNSNVTALSGVDISTGDLVPLGVTNETGILFIPGYEPIGGYEDFQAKKLGYSSTAKTVPVPYTGDFNVTLILLPPGPFDVYVQESQDGMPISAALVTVSPALGSPPGGFQILTTSAGWANGTLGAGNYTVTSELSGYTQLHTAPFFSHPWGAFTVVIINMTSTVGYRVDVRVLNNDTGAPLRAAHVQVGLYPILATSGSGWANQTSLKPAGTYEVVAWADNFTTNRTSVMVSFATPIRVVYLNLSPIRGCAGPGPDCSKLPENATQAVPLTLWPSGPPSPTLLYGGGALLILVPSALLWIARRRPGRLASGDPG